MLQFEVFAASEELHVAVCFGRAPVLKFAICAGPHAAVHGSQHLQLFRFHMLQVLDEP